MEERERRQKYTRNKHFWIIYRILLIGCSIGSCSCSDGPQLQAPRFTTQPSSSGSIVSEGRTKILQCHALENPVQGVVKCGGYRYDDGTRYIGDWNHKGQKHGLGHLQLPDGTRYDGAFMNGSCAGLGCMWFPDGAKYEGEFMQGWFHGFGIFWRADGMKYEGEFRGGRIWGLGLVTYADLTHGFPRNEGFFQDCRLVRKRRCPEIVQRAQKVALMARAQCDHPY